MLIVQSLCVMHTAVYLCDFYKNLRRSVFPPTFHFEKFQAFSQAE